MKSLQAEFRNVIMGSSVHADVEDKNLAVYTKVASYKGSKLNGELKVNETMGTDKKRTVLIQTNCFKRTVLMNF